MKATDRVPVTHQGGNPLDSDLPVTDFVPAGGSTNQILVKQSNADFDYIWATAGGGHGLPSGGTTGQRLAKASNADFDAGWVTDTVYQAKGVDAQTAVAGAATSTAPNVVVTSEALVAQTAYTLTLTDALITANSIIHCTPFNSVATGVQVKSITPGAGSVVIVLGFASYTGALTIPISILN